MEGGAASTWLCECRGWGAWGQGHAASLPGAWLRLLSLPLRDGKQRAALVRGAPWRTLSCSTRGTPKVRASPWAADKARSTAGPCVALDRALILSGPHHPQPPKAQVTALSPLYLYPAKPWPLGPGPAWLDWGPLFPRPISYPNPLQGGRSSFQEHLDLPGVGVR